MADHVALWPFCGEHPLSPVNLMPSPVARSPESSLLDAMLQALVTVNGLATSPFVLLVLAFIGAYLGSRVMEIIPFTRRIIERREARLTEPE
ncbi:hypothetical protein [Nonomuraea sp. KM88]|uniref:hypothetical protein n=1 Tax=Nonomuraea sp. KM88 TaxID=3457427 RepID=UPI003FCDA14E